MGNPALKMEYVYFVSTLALNYLQSARKSGVSAREEKLKSL